MMDNRIKVIVEHDDGDELHSVAFECRYILHSPYALAESIRPRGWRFNTEYTVACVRIKICDWPHATTRAQQRRILHNISSRYYSALAKIRNKTPSVRAA